MRKNLLYSVYATRHTNAWRANAERVLANASLFNGKKIIIIRSDSTTVPPAEVENVFAPLHADYVHRKNDPVLWEVDGFIDTLRRLHSLREDEITMYAHTKGVRYPAGHKREHAVKLWRDSMYSSCFNINDVELRLGKYPCAGPYKVVTSEQENAGWFYAGNFWWVRNKALFERNWEVIPDHNLGVECYLSCIFNNAESGHLGPVLPMHLDLYTVFDSMAWRRNRWKRRT